MHLSFCSFCSFLHFSFSVFTQLEWKGEIAIPVISVVSPRLQMYLTKFVKTFWQTKEDVIDTPKLDILALSYWHFFFLILLDRKATEKIDVETLSFIIIIIIIIILFFFLSALCETR